MRRSEHDLTTEEWRALQTAWGGCAYCGAAGKPLQRDCVLPISRGGRYTLANVVPACRSCNASKCNSEVTAWMRRRHHDERAFLLRHLEVHTLLAAPGDEGPPGQVGEDSTRAAVAARATESAEAVRTWSARPSRASDQMSHLLGS